MRQEREEIEPAPEELEVSVDGFWMPPSLEEKRCISRHCAKRYTGNGYSSNGFTYCSEECYKRNLDIATGKIGITPDKIRKERLKRIWYSLTGGYYKVYLAITKKQRRALFQKAMGEFFAQRQEEKEERLQKAQDELLTLARMKRDN